MKYVNFLSLFLSLSFTVQASDHLDSYYQKYEQCTSSERNKKPLTENVMAEHGLSKQDLKYILIIKGIRIATCSQKEEKEYLDSANKNELITTQSEYNKLILSKLSKEELIHINAINQSLVEFNIDVNIISLYDKLK